MQDAPMKPAAADSKEQHTCPVPQSSGPSQVIAGDWQFGPHIPSLSIDIKAGQQSPVALVQDEPSQSTAAPGAIVGCVQFGLVAP
jgi:hypothetical protein